MEIEETQLEVGDEHFPARITAPDSGSDVGAVLLPGASSGPFGGIFDELARTLADSGATFLQFETWDGTEELGETELADLHAELDAAVDLLRERECDRVVAVGKSFGGGIPLTNETAGLAGMVLWAPAVSTGFDERGSMAAEEQRLSALDIPVKIIQGTDDDVVKTGNSEWIADRLDDGELVTVPGAGHAYEADQHRETVVSETATFVAQFQSSLAPRTDLAERVELSPRPITPPDTPPCMSEDEDDPCDDCRDPVTDALARTIRLTVDRSQIDSQRLCPECFADWIDRYEEEMQPEPDHPVIEDADSDIIVD
jgi:dienelactone hydrolase